MKPFVKITGPTLLLLELISSATVFSTAVPSAFASDPMQVMRCYGIDHRNHLVKADEFTIEKSSATGSRHQLLRDIKGAFALLFAGFELSSADLSVCGKKEQVCGISVNLSPAESALPVAGISSISIRSRFNLGKEIPSLIPSFSTGDKFKMLVKPEIYSRAKHALLASSDEIGLVTVYAANGRIAHEKTRAIQCESLSQ